MIHHEVMCGGQLFRISIEPVLDSERVSTASKHDVFGLINKHFGMPYERLSRPTRGRQKESDARAVAAWLLREVGWTCTEIGISLNRNHSAVSHAIAKVRDRMDTEPKFRAEAEALLRALKG